jgi:hypothetical protein
MRSRDRPSADVRAANDVEVMFGGLERPDLPVAHWDGSTNGLQRWCPDRDNGSLHGSLLCHDAHLLRQ